MSDTPEITENPQPVRRRGAQPGNQNAFRHGFYALNLNDHPAADFTETEMRNLLGEVAMLKDYMYKLYQQNFDSTDSLEILETLRALTLAGISMARMLQIYSHIRISSSPLNMSELLKPYKTLLDEI